MGGVLAFLQRKGCTGKRPLVQRGAAVGEERVLGAASKNIRAEPALLQFGHSPPGASVYVCEERTDHPQPGPCPVATLLRHPHNF